MRGRCIRMDVEVRTRWASREVEPAEVVDREDRRGTWAPWLADGRYRSMPELARAVGVDPSVVTRVLKGRR